MARLTLILSLVTAIIALLGGVRLVTEWIRELRWRRRHTGRWSLLILALSVAPASANPYFNSTADNCNVASDTCAAHPTWILADDFDDGSWYATGNDGPPPVSTANDGWFGCNDAGGSTTCRTPVPPAVTAQGSGFGGAGYAAMSSPQGGNGGNSALAMHGFYPANATYSNMYIRFYLKFSSGYTFNNNQKFISLIDEAYKGGIDFGGAMTRNLSEPISSPQWDCVCANDANTYTNPLNVNGGNCYLERNIGGAINMSNNHWWFVEQHIGLNTYNQRNGIWEVWIKDCGVSMDQCTGTPTKVVNYDNVGWRGDGICSVPTTNIGSMWFDIWGNPADTGDIFIDNLAVATSGPIGFTSEGGGGSPIVLILEWAPVALGVTWHFRHAILSGLLAVWVLSGAVTALTAKKTKQFSYTAATVTMQNVNSLLDKVRRR